MCFYDISFVYIGSIFYRILLLLIFVSLRHLERIWLHRCKNMYTISSFYIFSCAWNSRKKLRLTLIICFTMLPLNQITCFLDVRDISLLLHHIQSVSLYCMRLSYIFILFQIYYIASVNYNWVFLACYTFTQLCLCHISETQHTTFP